MKAQNKFCRITRMVARERAIAAATPVNSLRMRVTPPASIATSEPLNCIYLASWKNTGNNVTYADLACDGTCRSFVVAGKHNDAKTFAMELTNRFNRGGLHRVSNTDDAGKRAIDRDPERRLAFFCQLFCRGRQSLHGDAVVLHQSGVADHRQISFDDANNTMARLRFEGLWLRQVQTPLLSMKKYSRTQRVFADAFERSSNA